jgi:hypothetical protein
MPEFTKPEYPKILTKKDWDKEKGIIAKMHGETGIGANMEAVQKLYDAVDWDKINMTGQRKGWTWGQDISQPKWDKVYSDAKAEVLGSLAAVSKGLYELRDLAQETQDKFKKSKTIPSSSTKHVAEIAKTADQLGVKLNKNSMSSVLQKMDEEFHEYVHKNFIDVFPAGTKKYVAKHAKVMDDLRASPTPANFSSACSGMMRDFTTGLGNIAKCHNKGFKVKNGPAAQKLFEAITPYADLKVECKTDDDVKGHLDRMDKLCAAVKVFVNSL